MVAGAAGVRRRLDPSARTVALTFDDGPDPAFTPRLLDTLEELDVKATFFLVGSQVKRHPTLVRRIVSAGHAVGSHSATHPDPWTVGLRTLIDDYRAGRRAVEDACGREVRLFRPPKGYVDAAGAVAMRRIGLRPWLWTRDPEDWAPGATAATIGKAMSTVEAGDVVLLHDAIQGPLAPEATDRSATLQAIPALVRAVQDRGLAFAVLG
jgi:peptidoglycan-N-acetylglucosamine deacetylase